MPLSILLGFDLLVLDSSLYSRSDVEIVGLGSESENSLVEEIEVVCCDEISISSQGLVASLFPLLPGNYSKLVESSTSPVWKHQSVPLYISFPPPMTSSSRVS